MWSELLSIKIAESYIITNYSSISNSALLTSLFYCPDLPERLGDLRKDTFLQRSNRFRDTIISNRIVFLSAAFETYFRSFLEQYIQSKASLYDKSTNRNTTTGDKIYGDVMKTRGMVEKIEVFSVLSGRSTKGIIEHYSYLRDLYVLRNTMAHDAGKISSASCSLIQHIPVTENTQVCVTSDNIVELASHTILIAEALDVKLTSKKP